MNKAPKERQVLRVRMDEMAAQEEAEVLERKETWVHSVHQVHLDKLEHLEVLVYLVLKDKLVLLEIGVEAV